MDLSEVFDIVNHDLLIEKLRVYNFNKEWLKFVFDYLSDRLQKAKFCDNSSSWPELLQGVSQSSVRRPLLFNIIQMICFI